MKSKTVKLVFLCSVCGCACNADSVKCILCKVWMHTLCIRGENSCTWSTTNDNFACRACACLPNGNFNFEKSLNRYVRCCAQFVIPVKCLTEAGSCRFKSEIFF